MPYDAFISYASQDLDLAAALHERLASRGWRVWFDRERLQPGFDWYSTIEQACGDSRVLLPVLTPHWKESDWTRFETYGAESVIPLLFAGSWDEVATPPLHRFQSHAVDCSRTYDSGWNALNFSLERSLAQPMPEKRARVSMLRYRASEHFSGRSKELLQMHEDLHARPKATLTRGRVLAIVGLGGSGKTTLARQYAEKYWRCYPEIYWADCRSELAAEFARILEHCRPDLSCQDWSVQRRGEAALQALGGQEDRLLILDNAEDEESIRKWLPNAGGCHVLVTTRYTHWSPSTRVLALDCLELDAGIHFMLQSVGRPTEPSERESCSELVKLLGGLPLAMEQAAAYIRQQGPGFGFANYLALFRRARTALLHRGASGSTEYEHPVATTWQATIQQLSPAARNLLRVSACLATTPIPVGMLVAGSKPPSPLRALLATEADPEQDGELLVREAIANLGAFSMIRLEDGHYGLHTLVRQVTMDSMSRDQVDECAQAALAAFLDHSPGQPDDPSQWKVWSALHPHAMALHQLAARLPAAGRVNLFDRMSRYNFGYARFEEAAALAREGLEAAEAEWGADSAEAEDCLLNLGESLRCAGRRAEAEAVFRRALAWNEAHHGHDSREVALCLNYLGMALDGAETAAAYTEGLAICGRIGLKAGKFLIHLRLNLAVCLLREDAAAAKSLAAAGLESACAEFGSMSLVAANARRVLGAAESMLGNHQTAIRISREAVAQLEELLGASHPDTLEEQGTLAAILAKAGTASEALDGVLSSLREKYGERLERCPEPSMQLARTFNNLAFDFMAAGRQEDAELLSRGALALDIVLSGANAPIVAHRERSLALILILQDRLDEAGALLDHAAGLCGATDLTFGRIVFLKYALSLLRGSPQPRELLALGSWLAAENLANAAEASPTFEVDTLLAKFEHCVPPAQSAFARALAAAMNDRSKASDLTSHPMWREAVGSGLNPE